MPESDGGRCLFDRGNTLYYYGSPNGTFEPFLIGALLGAATVAMWVAGIAAIFGLLFILSPVGVMVGSGLGQTHHMLRMVAFLTTGCIVAALCRGWAARKFAAWREHGAARFGVGMGALCALAASTMFLFA